MSSPSSESNARGAGEPLTRREPEARENASEARHKRAVPER